MGYKSVVIMSDGERASNGLVFQTHEEAHRAGAELLSRWMAPVSHDVEETTDPVNRVWHWETDCSNPLPEVKTYTLNQEDLEGVNHER